MRKYKKLPFKLLLAMMLAIVLTISIGLSIWLITDRIEIKPELDVNKVITQYLDDLSADYLQDTVFLPSNSAVGLEPGSEELTYYYKMLKDSDGNDVSNLEENKNYALVEGQNGPKNAGTYSIEVKYTAYKDTNLDDGDDSIIITSEVTFVINKAKINMEGISFDGEELTYDKNHHNIIISGTLPKDKNGNALISDVLYTCGGNSFSGATDAGTYNVTASFVYDEKNYETVNSMDATLKINEKSLNLSTLTFKDNPNKIFYHTGNTIDEISSSLIVTDDDGAILKEGEDYTVKFSDVVNLGTDHKVTITGIKNYSGTSSTTYTIKEKVYNLIIKPNYQSGAAYEVVSYNGQIQRPSVTVTDEDNNILDGVSLSYDVDSKNKGTYKINVTATKEGYITATKEITFLIQPINLTFTWSNNSFTYDKEEHIPTLVVNGILDIDKEDYKINLVSPQINAGTYTAKAEISNNTSGNYVLPNNDEYNFTISPRPVTFVSNSYGISYNSSYRTWNDIKSLAANELTFNNVMDGDTVGATITGMHNGVYAYGDVDVTGLDTSMTRVVGSAYQATASITNSNYTLAKDTFIFKYKTVQVNNSGFFTIEDAIAANGDIKLIGDESNYVLTSFSKILDTKNYDLYSRTLRVPYNSDGTEITRQYENTLTGVYSGLMIPSEITLNMYKSNIVTCAILDQGGTVERHGVIWNDGNMNFYESSNLKSYGFTKGNGSIVMNAGTTAIDVFYLKDWPGADEAVDLKNANAFPVQQWSVHNISCKTIYYKESACKAESFVVAISGYVLIDIKDIYIIGTSNTEKCLFKPNGGESTDYIEKSALISSDTFDKTNQDVTQYDTINIKGKYIDSNVRVQVKYIIDYSFETSTSIAIPLDYFNINILGNSTLELVNSSYVFMSENANLKVEETAELIVNGSAYLAMRNGSKLTNNGKLKGSGTFGGIMETTVVGASSTISNYGCDNISLKTSSTTASTFTQDATGIIGNSAVYDDNGNISKEEKYEESLFESGSVYIAKKSSDKTTYFFEGSTEYNTFTVNYDTNGGNSLSPTVIYSFDSSYIISSDDLPEATKDFYDFSYWYYLDANNQKIELSNYELSTTSISITLYAEYTEHEFSFVYTGGYNIDGTMTDITDNMTLSSNSFTTFKISDFVTVTVDGKEEKRLILPNAPSYSYNSSVKSFTGWYVGTIDNYNSTAFTYIRDTDLLEFISTYGDTIPIPLCCIFINAPVNVTIIDNDNKGVLNGNVNKLEFSFEQGGSLESNKHSFTVNSGSLDSDIEYSKYFAGFVISGDTSGKIYSYAEIRNMSISSNTTFEVKWGNKVAVTFTLTSSIWSDKAITKINGSSYSVAEGASKTYWFMPDSTVSVEGTKSYSSSVDVSVTTISPSGLGRWSSSYSFAFKASSDCTVKLS